MATTSSDATRQTDQLTERIAVLEEQVRKLAAATDNTGVGNTELPHKVLHACLNADTIAEEEELRMLENLLSEPR